MSAQPYRPVLMSSLAGAARSRLLRHVVLPLGDRAFGQRMMQRLRFLEEAQWWPRERVEEARDEALRRTVRAAFEVPFYRDLWTRHGVGPDDVRTPDDLERLPVVAKDDLRSAYPERVTRPTPFRKRELRTSGSTGKNLTVLTDSETLGSDRAALLLMLQWAGWRLGDPHVQTGMSLDRSLDKVFKDRMLGCRYVSAFDLTDEHLDRILDMIDRRRIEHLFGYPGSVYHLALRATQRGWNRPLRGVVTWGDMLYPRYRRAITEAFACRVNDTYGCAEGIRVAGQCGASEGYHLLELDTVTEVEDGGSLLLTRLHAGPMPLIRYRVGDLGRLGPLEACGCGREWAQLEAIEGRDTDIVVTPSGNRLIVHFFTGIIEHLDEVDSFQVVQEAPEAIRLRIVPHDGYSAEVEERLVRTLTEHGADVRIDVEVVDEIPLETTGKRRFVVSKLGGASAE